MPVEDGGRRSQCKLLGLVKAGMTCAHASVRFCLNALQVGIKPLQWLHQIGRLATSRQGNGGPFGLGIGAVIDG